MVDLLEAVLAVFGMLLMLFLLKLWWDRLRVLKYKRRAEEAIRQVRKEQAEQRYLARIKTLDQLNTMSPREFELFTGKLFEKMGYSVNITTASADEGVDIFLKRGGREAIVQCKKYKGTVGQPIVRDFYGTMVHSKANQGFIVTTGTFSLPAQTWAAGKPIHLVDGAELVDWLSASFPTSEGDLRQLLPSDERVVRRPAFVLTSIIKKQVEADKNLRAQLSSLSSAFKELLKIAYTYPDIREGEELWDLIQLTLDKTIEFLDNRIEDAKGALDVLDSLLSSTEVDPQRLRAFEETLVGEPVSVFSSNIKLRLELAESLRERLDSMFDITTKALGKPIKEGEQVDKEARDWVRALRLSLQALNEWEEMSKESIDRLQSL